LQLATFNSALKVGDFQSSYDVLIIVQDAQRQRNMLRILIDALCDFNEIRLLTIDFPFVGLAKEVEETLLFKARNEIPDISAAKTSYYKICYSYFTYHGDHQTAATCMYQFGMKLSDLACSGNIDNSYHGDTLSAISKCMLTSLTSLGLVDTAEQFVLIPIQRKNFGPAITTLSFHQPELIKVDIQTIRKNYHLVLSKLILYRDITHFQYDFRIPDADDVYRVFCDKNLYSNALQIALLFDFELYRLFDAICKTIIQFSKQSILLI
jgi:hypothetical protein